MDMFGTKLVIFYMLATMELYTIKNNGVGFTRYLVGVNLH